MLTDLLRPAAPTIELDDQDRRRANDPNLVRPLPRPEGAPDGRAARPYLIAAALGGFVATLEVAANAHEAIALFKDDIWPLIEQLLKHWPI